MATLESPCATWLDVIGDRDSEVQAFIEEVETNPRLLEGLLPVRGHLAEHTHSESVRVRATKGLRPCAEYALHSRRPPFAAIIEASKDFPGLDFLLWWSDPARDQGGMAVFNNGEVLVVLQDECCDSFYREEESEADDGDREDAACMSG